MDSKREVIAKNIAYLRKENGLSQYDLGEKLDFSDKTVSKWERAESMPDVDSLYALSELFGVTVDYFFHEDSKDTRRYLKEPKSLFTRRLLILILFCTAVLFISLIIFLYGYIRDWEIKNKMWIAFVWSAPVYSIITAIFFHKLRMWLGEMISLSLLLWTLLTSIYLTLLLVGQEFWMLFLIGIPIQAAIILALFIRQKK